MTQSFGACSTITPVSSSGKPEMLAGRQARMHQTVPGAGLCRRADTAGVESGGAR